MAVPTNTAAPSVVGAALVGSKVFCVPGIWTGLPGTFTYQWKRGSTAINGATQDTYTVTSADAGQVIKCDVTLTNASGPLTITTGTNPTCPAVGRTFYVDSVAGDDTRSVAQAQVQATPWKTLSKLTAATLTSGDIVALKANGATNYGTRGSATDLITAVSGLTVKSYGAGGAPAHLIMPVNFTGTVSNVLIQNVQWSDDGQGNTTGVSTAAAGTVTNITLDGCLLRGGVSTRASYATNNNSRLVNSQSANDVKWLITGSDCQNVGGTLISLKGQRHAITNNSVTKAGMNTNGSTKYVLSLFSNRSVVRSNTFTDYGAGGILLGGNDCLLYQNNFAAGTGVGGTPFTYTQQVSTAGKTYIHQNVADSFSGQAAFYVSPPAAASTLTNTSESFEIVSNTFDANGALRILDLGDSNGINATTTLVYSLTFKNNFCTGTIDSSSGYIIRTYFPGGGATMLINNNLYDNSLRQMWRWTNTDISAFATWQSTTAKDGNSSYAASTNVDATFHPTVGSDLVNTGTTGNVDVLFVLDGTATTSPLRIPYSGAAPEIGRYEYTPPAGAAPVNTVLPLVSGALKLRVALSCSTGTWTNAPTSYTYQWNRNGTAITGETSSSYVITNSDLEQLIDCTVTATNGTGSTSATSADVRPSIPDTGPPATYYVDPTNGFDDPLGGRGTVYPWRTLAFANDQTKYLEDGDTIVLRGTHSGIQVAPVAPISLNYGSWVTTRARVDVLPPVAPGGADEYAPPDTGTLVTDGTTLQTALNSVTATDILLDDGTYSSSNRFTMAAAHRVWALNIGGATLAAPLEMVANSELHGCVVSVTATSVNWYLNSCVRSNAANVTIWDCWIYGNNAMYTGIRCDEPSGVDIRRCYIRGGSPADPDTGNLKWYGIFVDKNDKTYSPAVPALVQDVDVAGISDNTGQPAGTVQFGVWMGATCTVTRAKVRRPGWSCFWSGTNCNDSLWTDLDGDGGSNPAFYIEHYTRRNIISNFKFGPNVVGGVVSEWDDPASATNPVTGETKAAGHFNTVVNGIIDTSGVTNVYTYGVWADQGTDNMTINGVKFIGQTWAAIIDKGVNTIISFLDTSRIRSVAVVTQTNNPPGGVPSSLGTLPTETVTVLPKPIVSCTGSCTALQVAFDYKFESIVFDGNNDTNATAILSSALSPPPGDPNDPLIGNTLIIQNCDFKNLANGAGILAVNPGDSAWKLVGCTVQHVGAAGIDLQGGAHQVQYCMVDDVGYSTTATNRDGIAVRGPLVLVAFCKASKFAQGGAGSGILVTGAQHRVFGNRVDCRLLANAIGISFANDDATSTTSTGYTFYNLITNVVLKGMAFS